MFNPVLIYKEKHFYKKFKRMCDKAKNKSKRN